MSTPRPLLLDPEVVLSITPDRMRALLGAIAAPPALVELADDPVAIARALFAASSTSLAAAASDALHHVAALASPRGRAAIVEALRSLDDEPRAPACAAACAGELPADLAARAVTEAARGDEMWQRTVERARIRLERSLPDRVGYCMWARREAVLRADALLTALAGLPAVGLGPWIAEEEDGTLHAALFWAEGPRTVLEIDGARVARRTVTHLRADLVSVVPAEGRVRFVTEDPTRVPLVAAALAGAGFGDREALVERPALTLKPLLALGEEGVARAQLPAGVTSLQVIACQVVEAGGPRSEVRAEDALSRAAALQGTHGGYPHRATFRLGVRGAASPVDAYIELPNRLGVSDPRWTREVEGALASIAIMSPGAFGDDVTTLGDGPLATWRLREIAGAEGLARLFEKKLLVPVSRKRTQAVALEAMRAWGHTLRAFLLAHPRDRGREYAFADDRSVQARTVGEVERRLFHLDFGRLRDVLRRDLGLDEAPSVALPEGVLDLGVDPGGRVRVLYVMATVPERARSHLASSLATAVLPAHAVILVPRGRGLGRELTVELDLAEQLGIASARAKVDRVLASLAARAPVGAPEDEEKRPAKASAAAVTLAIPGTWAKQRTDFVVGGELVDVRNGAAAVVVAAIAAAQLRPGAWTAHAEGAAQSIHEAMSHVQSALRGKVPRGFRLVQVTRLASRLNPAVRIGEVAWEALAEHPDPRIQKVARQRRSKR